MASACAGGLGYLADPKRELARSGSMNLPKPDESGVPAVHPDMCILRIRRNHLVEVLRPAVLHCWLIKSFRLMRLHLAAISLMLALFAHALHEGLAALH